MKSYYTSRAAQFEQKAMKAWNRADFYEERYYYASADMWMDRAGFYAREAVRYYQMASEAQS